VRSRPAGPWAGQPLSAPPDEAVVLRYRSNLTDVREFTATQALRAGLPRHRVMDLVIAIAELAANTLAHTNGPGAVTFWATADEIIGQVQDQGHIEDPLVGKVRPAPDAPGGGRGLWLVHEVCDQVEVRSGQGGTTVRVHMRRVGTSRP
jgi:anti-sigma regulatory factor (Ser/Thr protein kinase)